MKFDRNTVLGFVILALLFFGYFFFTNRQQSEYRAEQARIDSINAQKQKLDPAIARIDSLKTDSLNKLNDSLKSGHFQAAVKGTEQLLEVNTDLFKIAFTNKGGQPKWVQLNKFRNADSSYVKLAATDFDKISYRIATQNGQSAETNDFYFQPGVVTKNPDGSTTVSFTLASDSSSPSSITHQFVVKPNDYMIDFNVTVNGASQLLKEGKMNLTWNYAAAQQESGVSFEKQNTQVGYVEDGDFDYHTIGRTSDVEFNKSVKWIGVRQRFFNSYLIAKDNFSSGKIEWTVPPDDKKIIVEATANMQVPVSASGKIGFSLFYGPADYHILKKYDVKLSKLINLGQGMYSFVSPLNRFVKKK